MYNKISSSPSCPSWKNIERYVKYRALSDVSNFASREITSVYDIVEIED